MTSLLKLNLKLVFFCLQIVLNNLLEEQIVEERVNKKDKTGNGLKCKNRSRQNRIETGFDSGSSQFDDDNMVRKLSSAESSSGASRSTSKPEANPDLNSGFLDFSQTRPSAAGKRKLPPPTCTVTSQDQVFIKLFKPKCMSE
jgi:hypothetical protein